MKIPKYLLFRKRMDSSFMISHGYFCSSEACNPFPGKGTSTISYSVIPRSKCYLENERGSTDCDMCFRAARLSLEYKKEIIEMVAN